MNDVPSRMNAIILKHGGFSSSIGDSYPEDFSPFIGLGEVDVPNPGQGEVLIKVKYAPVNPSDVMFVQGNYGQPRVQGMPAGFEGTGTVVASGGGWMANWLKGKRVAFAAKKSGSWAQYAVANAATCIPLKSGVRNEDGAAMIVNPVTAAAMIEDIVKKSGSKAFVLTAAASQLGKLMISMGADLGLRPIAVVRRQSQIVPLEAEGAVSVLDMTADGYEQKLSEVLKEEKPEVFLDAVTGPQSAQIFAAMGKRANWVIYGRLSGDDTSIPEPGELIFLQKRVTGFWLTSWMQEKRIWTKMRVINLVQNRFISGNWQTDISVKFGLDEVSASLAQALSGGNNGKILIEPDH